QRAQVISQEFLDSQGVIWSKMVDDAREQAKAIMANPEGRPEDVQKVWADLGVSRNQQNRDASQISPFALRNLNMQDVSHVAELIRRTPNDPTYDGIESIFSSIKTTGNKSLADIPEVRNAITKAMEERHDLQHKLAVQAQWDQ